MTAARSPEAVSGFLVVDKPAGITSHQVVARARRALGTKKIGHAGTLDPMATGLLLLGVGAGTRLLGHLALADKTYEATIRLGVATVTDDAEGAVTAAPGASGLDLDALPGAVAGLTGDIDQVPSAMSAIKVDGRRAYALVRGGEDVALRARPVTVSRFQILAVRRGEADGVAVVDVDVVVDCSTGTYVRALARDLGAALGVGGHLTSLRRTRVGGFTLADATWSAPPPDAAGAAAAPALLGLADLARRSFPCLDVDAAAARDVGYGRPLSLPVPADPTAVLHGGRLLALYRPAGNGSVPVAVLAPA
nr:tRNA pseudouridine(55) synthase TruB [Propionibacterium sp.]